MPANDLMKVECASQMGSSHEDRLIAMIGLLIDLLSGSLIGGSKLMLSLGSLLSQEASWNIPCCDYRVCVCVCVCVCACVRMCGVCACIQLQIQKY